MSFLSKDTICAIATASGTAAVSMIRMSGNDSHKIALSRFVRKKKLTEDAVIPNRMYYGEISDLDNKIIDDVKVGAMRPIVIFLNISALLTISLLIFSVKLVIVSFEK